MSKVHELLSELMMKLLLVSHCTATRLLHVFQDLLPPLVVIGKLGKVSQVNLELLGEAAEQSTFHIFHITDGRINFLASFTPLPCHLITHYLIYPHADEKSFDQSLEVGLILYNVQHVSVVFLCLSFVGDEVPQNPLALSLVLFAPYSSLFYPLHVTLTQLNIGGHL